MHRQACSLGKRQGARSTLFWVSIHHWLHEDRQQTSHPLPAAVLVYGFLSSSGEFGLSLTSPPPPGNDECVDATPVGIGSTTNGTTVGATFDDTGFVSCGGADTTSAGVWFSAVVSSG